MNMRFAFALSASVSFAPFAAAETWLKIDPNDPFANEGVFHHFDVDS